MLYYNCISYKMVHLSFELSSAVCFVYFFSIFHGIIESNQDLL